jgi:predicted TIM-barrel enzyme
MKKAFALLFTSAVLLSSAVHAQEPDAAAIAAAKDSATRWLVLADAGKWLETWDQMAPAAQGMVTSDACGPAARPRCAIRWARSSRGP